MININYAKVYDNMERQINKQIMMLHTVPHINKTRWFNYVTPSIIRLSVRYGGVKLKLNNGMFEEYEFRHSIRHSIMFYENTFRKIVNGCFDEQIDDVFMKTNNFGNGFV